MAHPTNILIHFCVVMILILQLVIDFSMDSGVVDIVDISPASMLFLSRFSLVIV